MKQRLLPLFLTAALLLTLCVPVLANAAEPPCFTILVNNAPEDLAVSLLLSGEELPLRPLSRGWETYFRCLYHDGDFSLEQEEIEAGELRITSPTAGIDTILPVPDDMTQRYDNIFTLDLHAQTLRNSYTPARDVFLVALRVTLTLLVEGIVLFLFGYRKGRSFGVFLLVNLVTQTLLNLSLVGYIPPTAYWKFAYYGGEFLIFIGEAVVYALLLKEHSRRRAVLTAILANLASLILGGWLLSSLPM